MQEYSPIRVFIGYDESEVVAYHTLAHSIMETASQPVSITPVMLSQLKDCYSRPNDALASTQFSFSRFLVPYLAGYSGWAIFMDCDMLCREDIAQLWACRDVQYAVQVVKHEHKPAARTKFNDNVQTRYAKKNWSSVMLLNCARCTALSVDYVNHATGLELHQFKWLANDGLIGEIPHRWNHLVGYDLYDPNCALAHFTEGGPYFKDYAQCDYADEWFATQARANAVIDNAQQSAPSVVKPLTPQNEQRVTLHS
ncbi:MAG: hypothetical protein RIC89_08585 [Pseudomonadales bacterium]